MKVLKLAVAAVLALVVILNLGALAVSADTPPGTGPLDEPFIDNQEHTIPGNSSLWYRFDYAINHDTGERPLVTLRLLYGNKSGIGFEIWTSDTIGNMADNNPLGRGTAHAIDCNSGQVSARGECQSDDLTWSSSFTDDGTYYVRVINRNSNDTPALLTMQGTGVSLAPPAVPSGAPAAPAAAKPNTDDPNIAVAIDGKPHNIPANSAVWYRFTYEVNTETYERPIKTVTLVNGNKSGVKFQLWSPDNLKDWWDKNPVGEGTPHTVDCDTGQVEGSGGCQSENLVWSGSFGSSGTYWVRVINTTSASTDFVLTIQ